MHPNEAEIEKGLAELRGASEAGSERYEDETAIEEVNEVLGEMESILTSALTDMTSLEDVTAEIEAIGARQEDSTAAGIVQDVIEAIVPFQWAHRPGDRSKMVFVGTL